MGTYPVQTKFWCKYCANILKKVLKNSKKIMNVLHSLPHLYIKQHDQIHLTLEVKKDKFLTNTNSSNTPQNCLFCNF